MKTLTLCRFSLLLALSLGAALFCPALSNDAAAYPMIQLDLDSLSLRADHIVMGTVEKIDSHFLAPGSTYIVTDVTINVENRLMGESRSSRFVVRRLGGEVGKIGQIVYGEANFKLRDQVLLFAAERQGVFYTVGMAQGVMSIYVDPKGIQRVKGVVVAGHKLDDVVERVRKTVLSRKDR